MRIHERGEKGFTLIELLIVIAILGVLAAVVIPNVGRFIGRGEEEAASTELSNIQSAVTAMMVDNALSTLPTSVNATATNDMFLFPDLTVLGVTSITKWKDPNGIVYTSPDNANYVLYQHDITGGGANTTSTLVNYVATRLTKGTYTSNAQGTVTQVTTGY